MEYKRQETYQKTTMDGGWKRVTPSAPAPRKDRMVQKEKTVQAEQTAQVERSVQAEQTVQAERSAQVERSARMERPVQKTQPVHMMQMETVVPQLNHTYSSGSMSTQPMPLSMPRPTMDVHPSFAELPYPSVEAMQYLDRESVRIKVNPPVISPLPPVEIEPPIYTFPIPDETECGYCITPAMSYTPMQKWGEVYDPDKGFSRGTIFPELDLPFVGEEARK